MPLKSHNCLPLDAVMLFHNFRLAMDAVRRPTVESECFPKGQGYQNSQILNAVSTDQLRKI